MTNQEIFELIDRFERSSIRMMRLSTGAMTLEMSKDAQSAPAPAMSAPAQQNVPAAMQDAHAAPGSTINAPLAGVFYVASAPGAAPYVRVGDRVKQGDTVCLMEAMKMISEIPAPCDCIITEVIKENGVLAGYDEPLFRYQPC